MNVTKSKGGANVYSHVFNYTDHLGNIRLSYTRGLNNTVQLLEENHYYPFGLKHKKYGSVNRQLVPIEEGGEYWVGIAVVPEGDRKTYQYKYNGKEFQDELGLNVYDYGGRIYDPAGSRFWQIDPMADYREWLSPYNYVQNNPVIRIDSDGMLDDIVIKGANNSSVTIQTDLIDVSVNASSLRVDFGGNYSLSGDDILGAALDIVGIFDPTGVADGLNASLSASKGNWGDAIISGIGIIPYAGDLAKAGKIKKDINIINNAIDAVKGAEKTTDLAKAEARAAKLSKTPRDGKDFTKAGKEAVIDVNKAKNNGKTVCETCGTNTIPAKKDTRGVKPPGNRTEIDHVKRKREGGSGTPDNGQVNCRDCNQKKG